MSFGWEAVGVGVTAGDNASRPAFPDGIGGLEVRAALDRIVASTDFTASDRARRFLRYVVEETLAGRADRIKAFSVAVEVFGRDETFDPQNDPVVRIEAGRLRRALERYYLLSGKDDPVVIDIPKGGYVPTFSARDEPADPVALEGADDETPAAPIAPPPAVDLPVATPPPVPARFRPVHAAAAALILVILAAAAWLTLSARPFETAVPVPPGGPRILVLPFEAFGGDEIAALYAAAVTEEIVTALGHFKEITVLGTQTSRGLPPQPDLKALHADLGVQYVIEGSTRADADTMRVSVRLTSSTTGAVLWSRTYDNPISPEDLFLLPGKTAGDVAAAVAQPYGIVFQAETSAKRATPPNNLEAYLCTLSFYAYRAAISLEDYGKVRQCLETAVARFPDYATAWALLAYMYIDEIRNGFAHGDSSPVERALAAARTAVRLEPDNVRALQALATALYFHHDLVESFAVADRALALNPNDTELLGQIGQIKGQSGHYDEGRALVERALAGNPGHSSFYRGVLAWIAYLQGDAKTALREVEQVELIKLPIFHGIAAAIYAQNGMLDRGKEELQKFQEMAPGFLPNLWAELDARNIPVDAQLRIGEDVRRLGFDVPPRPSATGPAEPDAG